MEMKESGILQMSGDNEVGHNMSSINKPVPQEIVLLKN